MNLVKEFLLLKAKVDKLYCQLIAKSPEEQDPTVPNHVKTIKQEDIDNWNKVEDVEVQITEDNHFATIGQTQKDFNKNVSDYKTSSDLKNQEQDDRLIDIEGKNIAQDDLINDLQSGLDNQVVINENQDERIVNLEGINYTWSPTNRTLTLYDNNGTQLSQVSLVSLDNEGTDIRYNASTLSLDLYNSDNELLDSIPVSSFIGSVGTQLQLNSNQLQLRDSQGNVLSTVSFTVNNIQGLQTALDGKLDKGGYTGNASDLKTEIDGKLNKPTTTSNTTSYPYVVGENGNGGSARLPAGDLGKNFFNSDLSNTTARNHTMNAGITVKTLGNPHTLSGLPNKNADIANFRKVRVQNTSGLDAVVDSKNLLTDGLTSMTDAEKDAYRLASLKTNETYSTSQPRVDVISPNYIENTKEYIQYITLIGLNLFLSPSSSLYIYKYSELDGTLVSNPTLIQIQNFEAYQSKTSILVFGIKYLGTPKGVYKVKIISNGIELIQSSTFIINDIPLVLEPVSVTWDVDSRFNQAGDIASTPSSINAYTRYKTTSFENVPLYIQSNNFISLSDINKGVQIKLSCFLQASYNTSNFRVGIGVSDTLAFVENDYKNFGFTFYGSNNLIYTNNVNYANAGAVASGGSVLKTISDTLVILIKNNVITMYFENLGYLGTKNINVTNPLKLALMLTGTANNNPDFRQRITINSISKSLLP